MLGVTVRVRSAAKAVALDDALEAAALGRSGDLDLLAWRKDLDRNLVTKVVGRDRFLVLLELRVVEAEAAQHLRCNRQPGFRGVTDDCLVGATSLWRLLTFLVLARVLLLAIAELDGVEADFVLGQNLHDGVGRCLDDRAGDLLPLLVEDLSHAQFPTDYADHKSSINSAVRSAQAAVTLL